MGIKFLGEWPFARWKPFVNDISGKMYKVFPNGERKIEIKGVPMFTIAVRGLLDVEIHPNFEENNFVYVSYSDVITKPLKYLIYSGC